ncbi:hypothetical protein DL770_000181 [Monosporascus sp. CRB-9-2]|nr:hypothetical protein DL770_000181 [Monosporascus sp. CRB-9-2]
MGPSQSILSAILCPALVKDVDVKAILDALSPLLAPETIGSLVTILNNASEFLAKETVEAFKTVLSNRHRLLIGHITLILNSVGKIDLEGIIDVISPLLSPSSVGGLTRLVNNAELLLTHDFVNDTQTIIGVAVPVVGAIKRVDITSLLERARPLLGAFDRIDIEGIVDQIAP